MKERFIIACALIHHFAMPIALGWLAYLIICGPIPFPVNTH
jgi:hypothetical protein